MAKKVIFTDISVSGNVTSNGSVYGNNIGDITKLDTVNKDNLVIAINEAFSGSSGGGTVAIGSEIDTGTDNTKFASALALKNSKNVPSVAPGVNGNVLTSNGTNWTSSVPNGIVDTFIELGKTASAQQDHGGANLSSVVVSWDSEAHTSTSFTHSNTTNNSRITFNFTGRVHVMGTVGITEGGAARTTTQSGYKVNGGAISFKGSSRNYSRGSAYGDISVDYDFELDVTSGDYLELVTYIDDTDATYVMNSIVAECVAIVRRIDIALKGADGALGGVINVFTTTSVGTLTPESDTYGQFEITAQALALTIANHSTSTPSSGNKMMFRIKDNGTARAITFGTEYRGIGNTLPTTTIANKLLYLGFEWNGTDSKWDMIAFNQEI